jgi:hypothetical protein
LRNGPHCVGEQRVDMPRPERSICTATTIAPRWVRAAVRLPNACFWSSQYAREPNGTGLPAALTRSASSYRLHQMTSAGRYSAVAAACSAGTAVPDH